MCILHEEGMAMRGQESRPRFSLPGPEIYRAMGWRRGGLRRATVAWLTPRGPAPVMAEAGQRRRTYHPGLLTLGVSPRPRRDNRENFSPMGVGTRGSQ